MRRHPTHRGCTSGLARIAPRARLALLALPSPLSLSLPLRADHADTDAGYSLGTLSDRLAIGREYVFDSTTSRVKTSGSYGIGNIAASSNSCGSGAARVACVDFALASFYSLGVLPTVVAASLWPPGDPDAAALQSAFGNWSAFWRAHRRILQAPGSTHISRPTMRATEAVVHVDPSPSAAERALVSLVNPTAGALPSAVAVSLYYAGLAPGASVSIHRVFPGSAPPVLLRTATVGSDGGGLFDVLIDAGALAPQSYALFTITSP